MFSIPEGNLIPQGLRDLLPTDSRKKRFIENAVAGILENCGFSQITPPTFEYLSTFSRGLSGKIQKDMYKLIDRDGNILALRPEMTTSIARLVASHYAEDMPPHRFYYIGSVFRCDQPQAGWQREFSQAGAELIGVRSPVADAEMIAMAVDCLTEVGLRGFVIGVGSAAYLNGLLTEDGISDDDRDQIKEKLANKDIVALRQLVENLDIGDKTRQAFLSLHRLQGGTEVIDEAEAIAPNELCKAAAQELRDVFKAVEEFGCDSVVRVDLGTIRDLDYYTGIVFEGYIADIGFPLLGGGRYDGLMAKFGTDMPATGFAIGIERLLLAIASVQPFNSDKTVDYLIAFSPVARAAAIKKTIALRKKGISVELDINDSTLTEAVAYAKRKGITTITYFDEKSQESNHLGLDSSVDNTAAALINGTARGGIH